MKIDTATINGKEMTEYNCKVTGEVICIGDKVQYILPNGLVKTTTVHYKDGVLLPFDKRVHPKRWVEFGGVEYVDTDDIMLRVSDLPYVKL